MTILLRGRASDCHWHILRIACIGLAALLISGCASATPIIEPASISFAFHEADLRYYEGLLGSYSDAYPGATVELIPMDWNQIGEMDGDSADTFAADMRILSSLNQQGQVLTLDPFVQQDDSLDASDFYPDLLSSLTHEGQVWALPSGVDVYVMYLNQDLFTQYGATYPDPGWTWAEFLDRAIATRDDVTRVYGYTTTPGHWDAVLFIYQNGGHIVDSEENPTRLVFDDPLAIEALQWYASLFHEHDVAPTLVEGRTTFGGGNYAYYQGIRNGRVAMWILPISQRGGMMWPVGWLAEWRVAPPPQGAYAASSASLEAFAISAETDHPDACWQWISFLSKQMTFRLVPPRRSLVESEAFERSLGEEIASAARIALENAVMFSPQLWTRLGGSLEILDDAIGHIVEGKMAPDEAMDWARSQAPD